MEWQTLERAATCGALFDAGAAPLVIFSGAAFDGGGTSIAEIMAQASGIPGDAVVLETAARSTLENARFSAAILSDGATVIIVSNAYHLPRAAASFRLFGVGNITLVRIPNDPPMFSHYILREVLAIWFNIPRYMLWRAATAMGLPETITASWLG